MNFSDFCFLFILDDLTILIAEGINPAVRASKNAGEKLPPTILNATINALLSIKEPAPIIPEFAAIDASCGGFESTIISLGKRSRVLGER